MNNNGHTKEQARQFLKQQALNEIYDISDFTNFYRRAYYIVAKYGLQLKAKEEEFLEKIKDNTHNAYDCTTYNGY